MCLNHIPFVSAMSCLHSQLALLYSAHLVIFGCYCALAWWSFTTLATLRHVRFIWGLPWAFLVIAIRRAFSLLVSMRIGESELQLGWLNVLDAIIIPVLAISLISLGLYGLRLYAIGLEHEGAGYLNQLKSLTEQLGPE